MKGDDTMIDTKINLCDTCVFEIPTCDGCGENHYGIEFGDGFGNDNIIKCPVYIKCK